MAGTFYGYAERNADSYVDWREVGQYATDMIDETVKVRQEKKDALDAATRDALKFAANAPVGADTSVRKKALQMADMVSKNFLIQEKLMKSGKSDPKDYLIYMQNGLDTIDLSFNAMKAYQDEYQSTMDGINNKELSVLTAENIGFAETYGNLDTLGFTMSPDGKIMMGKEVEKEIDGKKVKSLENITSVNALNGLILSKIKHNKIEDQVNAYVQALGVDKRAKIRNATFDKQGQVITIEDIRQRKNEDPDAFQFREAELEQARSMIGDPSNIASILIDTKKVASNGKAYEVTNDENEAKRDPSKILRVFTPNKGYNFVVSKEQEQDAIDFTLNRMRERYKYEEKVDVGSQTQDQTKQPTQADIDRNAKETKENEISNMLGQFWWGNDAQVDSAANYFKGFKDKEGNLMFTDIDRTADGLRVVMANGSSTTIPLKGKTQADFIRSAGPLLAGELDINAALRRGSYSKDAKFNEKSKGRARTIALPEQYEGYLESNLSKDIVSKTQDEALAEIEKLATAGGFEVETSGVLPGRDFITITRPAIKMGTIEKPKETREFSFDETDPIRQKKIRASIIKFLKTYAVPDTLKQSLSGQNVGSAQQAGDVQQRIGGY